MKYYIEFKRKLFDLIIDDEGTTVKAFDLPQNIKSEHICNEARDKMLSRSFENQIGNACYREVVGNYTTFLRLNNLPSCVSVDASKFLATIKIDISNTKWMKKGGANV